ncbi:hypothetical protein WDW86_11525 [Bdellovibrionota bacterium FG-2]
MNVSLRGLLVCGLMGMVMSGSVWAGLGVPKPIPSNGPGINGQPKNGNSGSGAAVGGAQGGVQEKKTGITRSADSSKAKKLAQAERKAVNPCIDNPGSCTGPCYDDFKSLDKKFNDADDLCINQKTAAFNEACVSPTQNIIKCIGVCQGLGLKIEEAINSDKVQHQITIACALDNKTLSDSASNKLAACKDLDKKQSGFCSKVQGDYKTKFAAQDKAQKAFDTAQKALNKANDDLATVQATLKKNSCPSEKVYGGPGQQQYKP